MSKRARRPKRVIDDMKIHPRGSCLHQNSMIAPGDVGSSKKKRNPPGNPKPDAEVVALSPRTLLATNRFVCEVCNKGFQRDQNLQLHLRGHNMPWKLKQRNPMEPCRRVYLCPEPTCVHHNPSRALGDLTGIKKHYCRKHGEKNLKCDKCNKRYAVESDWKQHFKTCGTHEYRCECNALFSRKDSFMTHRTMCNTAVAADLEATQMPPVGAGLNVDSGSGDSLGLSGTAAHMHGFADHGQSSSAAAEASQFDHVMSSYSGSSMFRSLASDFCSSSFFLGGGAPTANEDMSEHCGDHYEGSQRPLPHGKAPLDDLMHLPGQLCQPTSGNAYLGLFSSNTGGASGSQGPLPHGKEPFHGNVQLLPEQQQHHWPASTSNANANINLGFLGGNSGGWSGSSQQADARPVIRNQYNGGAGGSNTGSGSVMASSTGSHFGGGFPSGLYNSSTSPSAGLSATALLMKAAQMGSTSSSTTRTGPSALLHAAGFTGTVSGQQGTSTSRTAAEEGISHEAHFNDLIMNSLPLMGGATGGFPAGTAAGMAGVDGGGNLSARDFLGVGKDDAMAPPGFHTGAQLDPSQMKWFV